MRKLVLLLILIAACRSKPKHQDPPPNVPKAGSNSGTAPDLILPHGDGTPPKKTAAKLDKAALERLGKLEFPGFHLNPRDIGEKVAEVRQQTLDHPRLWATVTIKPCLDCLPMDLAKWKEKTEDLKIFLGALRDARDVDFEVGQIDLHGQPLIYTYQLGFGATPGEGGGSTAFTDAYVLYYNDGTNEIRVVAEYKDDPVADKASLVKVAPKQDLQLLALSMIDAYTHAW